MAKEAEQSLGAARSGAQGKLFTQDFLLHGILSTPVWEALEDAVLDRFIGELQTIYSPFQADSVLNEASTEAEIIGKVLSAMGWGDLALPQVTASGTRREDVPDLLLYPICRPSGRP